MNIDFNVCLRLLLWVALLLAPSLSFSQMSMSGALGDYPITRDASGTSWQPDNSAHAGAHHMQGDWMLMGHGMLDGVYDWQQGPRGDEKTFLSGMLMGMASRRFASANGDEISGSNTLQFRAMLSPEPLMGASGYPLLLATGETADGKTHLIDRQHPHDLFMELSASWSHAMTSVNSFFVYTGLPGEPAFGPPAFMHRQSILDSPEAPITHHWLDSTHITYGVVTAGLVHSAWKLEGSRFRGREPDQHRYNIETGALDSNSARLSWNPSPAWALQVSWAHQVSPEQLEPEVNQTRFSASAIYTHVLDQARWWSVTTAWGSRRSSGGKALNAYFVEAAWRPHAVWTVFARAEQEKNDELVDEDSVTANAMLGAGAAGKAYGVGKISLGAVREFSLSTSLKFGIGALYAMNFVPSALESLYGRTEPQGAMGFVRLRLQ